MILPKRLGLLATFLLLGAAAAAAADPLTIDLTSAVPAPGPVNLGQGTVKNPAGHAITADNRSLLLDGQRWAPVVGEFHYSRYAPDEWRDELLKMKAGGINVVSTYVFWIHHEEERGKFDWSGQKSLRGFLQLCQEVGLLAIVRMGPWDHGEVRNGGLPDWVLDDGTRKMTANQRITNPDFLELAAPMFRETAAQMKGLLWKDGGPVIGVQMDNECSGLPYLFSLKKMAQADGVDVPLYTMTGWNHVAIPTEGLLPLFGAYSVPFWTANPASYRRVFVFSDVRDDGDLGAQMQTTRIDRSKNIALFPYACCEIGPGMMSSYARRIKVVPDDVAAMALTKLGCGSNMQGYYMYHGGNNPDARLSSLNEQTPNAMPFKDYDFQAPLGANGEVREQYFLLREQHLFLQDFGSALAQMPPVFPDARPRDVDDFETVRWDVRWDGSAGFLFFNNRLPVTPLPEHAGVQFALKTKAGTLLVPSAPTAIPSGSYGVWPINLDCDGVKLDYATAQPLCHLRNGNAAWYFFRASDGIPAEFSLRADPAVVTVDAGLKDEVDGHLLVRQVTPGLNRALSVSTAGGGTVNFVVLTPAQAEALSRVSLGGSDYAVLSRAVLLAEGDRLRWQATNSADLTLSVFPPLDGSAAKGGQPAGNGDGIFTRVAANAPAETDHPAIKVTREKAAGPSATSLHGMDDATWGDAAAYRLNIPAALSARRSRVILKIRYLGDAARVYLGDKLFADNFYNGDPFSVALWRIPAARWPELRLQILPYSDALAKRLPVQATDAIAQAKTAGTLDDVTIDSEEVLTTRGFVVQQFK